MCRLMSMKNQKVKKRASTRLPARMRGARLHQEEDDDQPLQVESPPELVHNDIQETVQDFATTPTPTSATPTPTRQKRTRLEREWSTDDMAAALEDVEENGMSVRVAAKKWRIPTITLTN